MRNSFNTASFSEVVHEIREDAAEGLFRYVGKARHSPLRGLSAEVGPAMFGSVKSARRYSYSVRTPFLPTPAFGVDEPSPMDLALTGIGSCSLMTLVGGGSAKGIVFESVEAVLACGGSDDSPVSICFEIDGDVTDEQIAELLQRVQQRSPNCVTLPASVPVEWDLSRTNAPTARKQQVSHEQPTADQRQSDMRRIRWISGPQSESFADTPAATTPLRVDNPKQLTGVDWGPNPQEYLMMGYAAEVAAYLGAFSRDRLGHDVIWDVTARCTEDVSGLLRADPDAVVHLQDVSCSVSMSPPPPRDASAVEELVDQAVSASSVGRLISEPQAVHISSRRSAAAPPTG
ncbi:OsmC family protein [Streptomyces sp. HC307]|uniref:OsmC family protein n=1 Tax=Streptomyces flavusporus TaxID=3385496 RepID=UPI003916D38D